MNVVDASAWLEYFANGPNASFFAENEGLQAIAAMQQDRLVALDGTIALAAARLSLEHKLPMADSIIFATAQELDATLWTQDADFKGLPGVRYRPAKG